MDIIDQLCDVVWGDDGIISYMRYGDGGWEDLKPEVISLAEKIRDMYVSSEVIPTKLARLLIDTVSEFANYQHRCEPYADLRLEFRKALGDLGKVWD